MDGWLRIGTKVETKNFDAQIKLLEKRAETIKKTLESDLKVPVELRMDEESRLKLRSDLQKTKNQIISLQQQADKGVNLKSKKNKSDFEDMAKSAKRFALSLISIRGIYSLLSKASQSYMATDEKTTNQMEANWVGLGTIMKPAIDLIVSLMKKAVTSVLYFMSVLTGVNYIEKANTAILKKQTQATNELTKANDKLTTSFDEMSILKDSSSSSSGANVDTSALFDINNISESARNTIKKIGEALQPVYETIKDIIKWCLDNPNVLLVTLGGVALLTTIGKILGFGAGIGSTGLIGILGTLGLLVATSWVIKLAMDGAEEIKEAIGDIQEQIKTTQQKHSEAYERMEQNIKDNIYTTEELEKATAQALGTTESGIEDVIEATTTLKDNTSGLRGIYNEAFDTEMIDAMNDALDLEISNLEDSLDVLLALYEQGKLDDNQKKQYIDQLKRAKDAVKNANEETGEYEETLEKINDVLKIFGETNVTAKVDIDTSKATQKAKDYSNSLSRFFGGISEGISSIVSYVFTGGKTKLATGGIINNPGRGVNLGSAIGGEAGAEGVIPLTDSQAMETLGQAIGKHVNIALTNITKLDNRQLAREQKKINAQNDFAMNR